MKGPPLALCRDEPRSAIDDAPDVLTRAAGILDAYWSKHNWPSMGDVEAFHTGMFDLRDGYGEDYDDAEGLVHDTATNLGWTIAMVDGWVELLVRPGTP